MGKLIPGVNDLYTWCQNNGKQGQRLLQEWVGLDEEGNSMDIKKITYRSNKKVFWKCKDCGNKWVAIIASRTTGRNCPFCSGNKASDKNNLLKWCQNNGERGQRLLQEWVGLNERGYYVDIKKIAYGSGKKVFWKCKDCGREWISTVVNRTNGSNCSSCARKVTNKNSLLKWCENHGEWGQRLLQEWTGLNEEGKHININDISYGSAKKVQWQCESCENIWISNIEHRTIHNNGCPKCAHQSTSYPEQFIYQVLKQIFPTAENRYRALKDVYERGIEYDIAIPIDIDGYKAVCIEYSPTGWHASREDIDALKRKICQQYNIKFIEIIEDTYNEYKETWTQDLICFHMNSSKKEKQLIKLVAYILQLLHHNISEIDLDKVKKDAWEYSHGKIPYEQSIAFKYPNLAKEWHPTLNGNKTPDQFKAGSSKYSIWWKCPNCGFEWKTNINNRTSQKTGCKQCGYNWFKEQSSDTPSLKIRPRYYI